MSNEKGAPKVPDGLGLRGAAFWKSVQSELEFDARETDLLIEICRTLDTIDLLAAAVARDGLMLVGSQGQQVLNAAVGELRQQQAAYARLCAQLNMESAEAATPMRSPRAASASATAKRRWAQKSGFGA